VGVGGWKTWGEEGGGDVGVGEEGGGVKAVGVSGCAGAAYS